MKLIHNTGPSSGGQKPRRKKFNLEDWERGPQTQYVKKAEKYYTNEGTN